MKNKAINYLYLFIFFGFLVFLISFQINTITIAFIKTKLYFIFYGICQLLIELLLFLYISHKITKPYLYRIFAGFFLFILIFHLTDFIMIRLMDTTIGFAFKILFYPNLNHLFCAIRALNLNLFMGCFILTVLTAIPFLGIFFYWITEKISKKKPFFLSKRHISLTFFSIVGMLILLDLSFQPLIPLSDYTKLKKILPFGSTLFSPKFPSVALEKMIAPPISYKEFEQMSLNSPSSLLERPNIYLFIIETLRKDFVSEMISPALYQFQKENIDIEMSYSNANATYLSWFSIFFSSFPFNWNAFKDQKKTGSPPLHLLKKLGYKIRLYTSSELGYFDMGTLIFGDDLHLCDHYQDFFTVDSTRAWERDGKTITFLKKDLEEEDHQKNTLFIIFLDSTHSEYSYPPHFLPVFTPVIEKINYLRADQNKKNLDKIKNRYKNSIFYIDTLFSSFLQSVKKTTHYDESIIIVTGDHGEEFFEEGALFHGSHLNDYQLKVPLIFKLGNQTQTIDSICSHIDIFPTLFEYLKVDSEFLKCFCGESIHKKGKWPFNLAFQQNGLFVPDLFLLNSKNSKMIGKFSGINQEIEIVSINNFQEKEIANSFYLENFNEAFLYLESKK